MAQAAFDLIVDEEQVERMAWSFIEYRYPSYRITIGDARSVPLRTQNRRSSILKSLSQAVEAHPQQA